MESKLPPWLKIRPPTGGEIVLFQKVSSALGDLKLNTICQTGKCPNRGECWSAGTATFLLMGNTCTRRCHFCNCPTAARAESLEADEPANVVLAVRRMGLAHVVLTCVARDDLPDQGASHIAKTINAIKADRPSVTVEALIPDFRGNGQCLSQVLESGVDVLSHNIEVVRQLQKSVRDHRAGYEQSLAVLANAKRLKPQVVTKSALMLGLGETQEQISQAMDDLRGVGVDILTIGQYLRPNTKCLPVKEYVTPEKFGQLEKIGLGKGFKMVVAGPFVRSSYKAAEAFEKSLIAQRRAAAGTGGGLAMEIKTGKSVFKAGKLLKVFVEYDNHIRKIKITGDFFLHPEEKIVEIEQGLVGVEANQAAVNQRLSVLLKGIDVFGFDQLQLSQAIAACFEGENKAG
ncbi:lipoyl synthase [Candidatus Parvarchaeota archaeon]|nr:lipoyl synthase [Candidatus Parvarchaeota archaeon]